MEEFVTKVFTLDNTNNNTVEFNSAIEQPALNSTQIRLSQPAIHIQEPIVKGSKKIKNVNPYYSYFPDFYTKELKKSFVTSLVWGFMLLIITALCAFFTERIITSPVIDNRAILTLIPITGLVISLFVLYLVRYLNFKNEAKTINFKDEKVISTNVTKVYKSLKTGYININWMSLLSYTISLLTLLINCIVCYCMYDASFGDVYTPIHESNNYAFAFVFWIAVVAVIVTFIMQASLLLESYIRYSRIENFYNFCIVSNEELILLKKKKNRRDMFIYLAIVCTIILIGWLIVKLCLRRKKQTKVVVNA